MDTIRNCERCGKDFDCLKDDILKCWCNKFEVGEGIRKEIKKKYKYCLCESCLNELKKEMIK